ncbi:hypothetical protein [Streptomyces sp. NPDC056069]|uniref:hypothetical protein n=1 Tax=Streptomyces sp. NPDC056069 TaxID=3345702 RepID=UPI0035DFB913
MAEMFDHPASRPGVSSWEISEAIEENQSGGHEQSSRKLPIRVPSRSTTRFSGSFLRRKFYFLRSAVIIEPEFTNYLTGKTYRRQAEFCWTRLILGALGWNRFRGYVTGKLTVDDVSTEPPVAIATALARFNRLDVKPHH